MPTVKVTVGVATVEIEATEMSAAGMAKLALETLQSAIQMDPEHAKTAPLGFGKGQE